MKTVLFDLDGTLLNTLDDLTNAVNAGLLAFNFPLRTKNEIRLFIGNGTTKLIERACPENTSKEIRDQVFEKFAEHYTNHYTDCTIPYKGVKELLLRLKKDYQLVVVSNKVDEFAKSLVELHFPGIFTLVQGTYLGKPKKPDTFVMNAVFETLNITAKDCVYIGDTNTDVETGRNSKIPTILVQYGFRSKEEIQKIYPNEVFADSFNDLENKIKSILG
ncbi:MAG: HAD-IA family hydrolase [Bacilli bacterium]|nr:HAD-IA family hydrolase [Bacilli bacterium]